MHFPKSWVFKLQIHTSHYTSQRDEINCVGISKVFSIECNRPIFKSFKLVIKYLKKMDV